MKQFLAQAIVIFCVAVTLPALAADTVSKPIIRSHIPTLMEATRFSGTIALCGEKIPHGIPEIRERLEKEMMLSVWNRPQVVLWLKRAHRYFPHIEKILKQENLPQDLKYLPIVESALLPHSRSGKGAVGYWQFLKSTGKHYGLRVDRKIDQRKNLFKSTRAACGYIKKLYKDFDSYLLAIAAYNMGENGLKRAIKAQDEKNFFSLYLPRETQRYLLKIIAAKLIIENPGKYGFGLSPQDLYPVFSYSKINFSVKGEVPLVLIAKSAQISFKTFKDYNPDIQGYYLEGGKSTVLVPKGKEKGFKTRFRKLQAAWKNKEKESVKVHVVRPGESLIAIASRHQMTLAALLELNKFSRKKVIHPGGRLLVR